MDILDTCLWVFVGVSVFGVVLSLHIPKRKIQVPAFDSLDVGFLLIALGILGSFVCWIVYAGIWFVNLAGRLFL